MDGRSTLKLSVKDLNKYFGCVLCDGYFRDAHCISECMHLFCKSCLHREFSKFGPKESKHCPLCPSVNLGLAPWTKIVADRTLQALVDKIFPQCEAEEKIAEEEFNRRKKQESSAVPGEANKKRKGAPEILSKPDQSIKMSKDDHEEVNILVKIRLLPIESERIPIEERLPPLVKPTLLVPASNKVWKIQRSIHSRLSAQRANPAVDGQAKGAEAMPTASPDDISIHLSPSDDELNISERLRNIEVISAILAANPKPGDAADDFVVNSKKAINLYYQRRVS